MEDEGQPFSELQLGIRELFRIVVPGAYAVLLIAVLPGPGLPDSVASSTLRLVAVAFFLGLVGYALRAHECWWPYSASFDKFVKRLNAEISRVVGEGEHRDLYKYFLTVGRRDVSDRVHYFSSFYYMLIALSLFSALAGLAELFIPALQMAYALGLWFYWTTVPLILCVATASQLLMLYATDHAGRKEKLLPWRVAPAALTGIAAVILLTLPFFTGPSQFSLTRAIWIAGLSVLTFVFANLGNNHWKKIILEQIVHVRSSKSDIEKLDNESNR